MAAPITMTAGDITASRLRNQLLTGTKPGTALEVVRWMGCIQSPDYHAARQAITLRSHGVTPASIDQLINTGQLLRAHLLKPVPQLVMPVDAHWMRRLTAPHIKVFNKQLYRTLGIDAALLKRSKSILTKALRNGQQLTRLQLLPLVGLPSQDLRGNFLLMQAELDGVICSGRLSGPHFTYMLAPHITAPYDEDTAITLLAKRYFTSRGPARLQDFVYWSGLSVAQAKKGIAHNSTELAHVVVNGEAYWFAANMDLSPPLTRSIPRVPVFDEWLVGYEDGGEGHQEERRRIEKNSFF